MLLLTHIKSRVYLSVKGILLFFFPSFPVPIFHIHLLRSRLKKKINFIMATRCRSRDTKIHSASDLINLSGGASGQEWRCDRSDCVLNLSRRSSDTTPTFGRVAGIPRRIGRGDPPWPDTTRTANILAISCVRARVVACVHVNRVILVCVRWAASVSVFISCLAPTDSGSTGSISYYS